MRIVSNGLRTGQIVGDLSQGARRAENQLRMPDRTYRLDPANLEDWLSFDAVDWAEISTLGSCFILTL
jgi:hypothetical protein